MQSVNTVHHFTKITPAGQKRIGQAEMEAIIVIPVVVHVIHTNISGTVGGSSNSNISDLQINSQIRALNEDYQKKKGSRGYNTNPVGADLRIEFKLANKDPNGINTNGINRIYNSKSVWDPSSQDNELKALSYWPSSQYLNIWVVPALYDNVLGYAQFPSESGYADLDNGSINDSVTDGVVIAHIAFGTTGTVKGKYAYGRTTTHEIGHWLGLVHIWGDKDCGDDYIEDTPVQSGPNTYLSENCPPHYSTCRSVTTLDMSSNYLDLSPDICMNIFTQGQKQRIRNVIYSCPRRKALLSSPGFDSILTANNRMLPSSLIKIYNSKSNTIIVESVEFISSGTIEISDLLGRKVYQKELLSGVQTIEVSLIDLPKGILTGNLLLNGKIEKFKILNEVF